LNIPAVALEELIAVIYTVIYNFKLYFWPKDREPRNNLPKWQNSARWVKIRSLFVRTIIMCVVLA
jgi:hypothetical protein